MAFFTLNQGQTLLPFPFTSPLLTIYCNPSIPLPINRFHQKRCHLSRFDFGNINNSARKSLEGGDENTVLAGNFIPDEKLQM